MPLGIPVGERMEARWEGKGAAGGDGALVEERDDAEQTEYDEEWSPEGALFTLRWRVALSISMRLMA